MSIKLESLAIKRRNDKNRFRKKPHIVCAPASKAPQSILHIHFCMSFTCVGKVIQTIFSPQLLKVLSGNTSYYAFLVLENVN